MKLQMPRLTFVVKTCLQQTTAPVRQSESVDKQCENYAEILEFNHLARKPTAQDVQQIAELRTKYKDRFSNTEQEQLFVDAFGSLLNVESRPGKK
jgi:hypothetical protein